MRQNGCDRFIPIFSVERIEASLFLVFAKIVDRIDQVNPATEIGADERECFDDIGG